MPVGGSPTDRLNCGDFVKNTVKISAVTILTLIMLALPATSQVMTSSVWTDFYGDVSTFNGQPLPIGSIVDAFDPDGVHCGTDTVTIVGKYGFMPVYGDDATTPGVDEGATMNDPIRFEINGRPAGVLSGDSTWDNTSEPKLVELAATATIAISAVTLPDDMLVAPGDTVRVYVTVRNDGDGIDFYGVSATNSNIDFATLPQTEFVYADPAEEVMPYFDIEVPLFVSNPFDTASVVNYSIFSELDPTQKVDGSVTLYLSVTDAPSDPYATLPSGFGLYQNYPNPFNPTTTISYTLPERSDVSLEVFDVLGRTVSSQHLGSLPAGDHEFEFDGAPLSSGVYFYRMTAGENVLTKKMVLLK